MNNKERFIDLRQFFLYLWKNIIILIVIGGLCAFGLAYRNYKKQKNSPVQSTSLSAIISQNRDSYYNGTKNYTDANRPVNTVESRVKLYIDFNIEESEADISSDSNLYRQLAYDACALCVSESSMQDVIDKLNLHSYDDMKKISAYDLSWMINKNIQGAHVMIIDVTDVNAARAHDIAEAVTENFIDNATKLKLVKNVSVIDKAGIPTEIVLESNAIILKTVIKNFIIGGAAGVVLTAVVLLLIFIIKDAVRTSADIEFAGLKRFGRISLKQKKYEEDMKRLAVSLSSPDNGKIITLAPVDKKADKQVIVEGMEKAFGAIGKKVKVLSGDLGDKIISNGSLAKESLKADYLIIAPKDMVSSADALIAAQKSDTTILIAGYGKSRMKNLISAREELGKMNVNIPGVVVIE